MRIWCLALLALLQAVPASFPQAEIANGRIRAQLYLPDAQAGYYRGTRFDWSGVVSSLKWNGHEYFGQWFERHDPRIHDAITGPVEEFLTGDSSLAYAEVKPGESFVRIGVGAVRKPEEAAYRRFGTYDIVDPGTWTVKKGSDSIEFVHRLGDTAGYAYVYRKTLRLADDSLILEHSLENTGRKTITTSVYNHNFFTLDDLRTGPDAVVRLPFDARAARPLAGLAEIRGREITFLRPFEQKETVFTELEGFGGTPSDYDFRLENRKTGAGVRITGDRPLAKLLFWSAWKTVCPEPYIDLRVEPGQQGSWRITYQFYQAAVPAASPGTAAGPSTHRSIPTSTEARR
jgi:hypothetical protein